MPDDPQVDEGLDADLARALQERRERLHKTLRDCPTCGTPYHPTKEWQRFCSVTCRSRYHNDKEELRRDKQVQELYHLQRDYEELMKDYTALRDENVKLKAILKRLE